MDPSEVAYAEGIQMLRCQDLAVTYLELFELFQEIRLVIFADSCRFIPPVRLLLRLLDLPPELMPPSVPLIVFAQRLCRLAHLEEYR